MGLNAVVQEVHTRSIDRLIDRCPGKINPNDRCFSSGERLATVPEELFLRPPIAMRHGESQWAGLISALLDEMYLGTHSKWFPYISMLPSQALHPLMWSEEQIEARLDGSPMRNLLESRLEECSVISNDLGKREDHVRWAYASICSRSFALGKVKSSRAFRCCLLSCAVILAD